MLLGRGPSEAVVARGKDGREETRRQKGHSRRPPCLGLSPGISPAPSKAPRVGGVVEEAESALWPRLSQRLALKWAPRLLERPPFRTPPGCLPHF